MAEQNSEDAVKSARADKASCLVDVKTCMAKYVECKVFPKMPFLIPGKEDDILAVDGCFGDNYVNDGKWRNHNNEYMRDASNIQWVRYQEHLWINYRQLGVKDTLGQCRNNIYKNAQDAFIGKWNLLSLSL
jgi:hypothetical protein